MTVPRWADLTWEELRDLPPHIVAGLLAAIARELGRHGVAALAIANGHLDPAHLGALKDAADRARRDGSIPIVCPDLTRKPWAPRLTEEFRSGACHAGRYESSIVMAERPDLVRRDVMRSLPPNPASLSRAIRDGLGTFEEAGGPQAYFGWPADATDAEGRETIEALGQILCDAVLEAFGQEHATI